ncbi:MAG: PEP-CTERM sorting domain-containing protein [Pirellulales bacterium]|nr:PEP-CTERM sorting domain-containing protein [Pirellulales bacterium]
MNPRNKGTVLVMVAAVVWMGAASCGSAAVTTLFSEDFNGLVLGPNMWEPNGAGPYGWANNPAAFTHTPPTGWTNDRGTVFTLGDPNVGVPEWEGWSFANKYWWVGVATDGGGDGRRDEFTKGLGTVAIVDADEWDDLGDPAYVGTLKAEMLTHPVSMTGAAASSAVLQFDSCWRPYAFQRATVDVSYDGGSSFQEIMRWESDEFSPNFKDDNSTNDTIQVRMNNPVGATEAILRFGFHDAGNDWFWAIDNVQVSHSGGTVMSEDFEGVPLGPPEWEPSGATVEPVNIPNAFTHTPPDGWTVDNSQMPGGGVPEYSGWSFAPPDLWVTAAEGQGRELFTKGQVVIAIADSDEWDDAPHDPGTMNTFMSTPEISLAGIAAGTATLKFDSGFQTWGNQTVTISVSYDGAAPVEVLRWNADTGSPYYKADAPNESVTVNLANPAGAGGMVLTFGYINGNNDWYWAVDNIVIEGDRTSFAPGDADGDGSVDKDDVAALAAHWLMSGGVGWAEGDFNDDDLVDDLDLAILAANWQGAAPGAVPEPSALVLIAALALAGYFGRRRPCGG